MYVLFIYVMPSLLRVFIPVIAVNQSFYWLYFYQKFYINMAIFDYAESNIVSIFHDL